MTRAPIRQSSPTANWRAILFGLLLLLFEVCWVTVAKMKYGSQATALPLFIYPVFILFYLVVINNGLSLFLRLRLFTAADLLTIYVMLVIGTSFSAYGMLQIYLPLWFILTVLLRLKTIGEIYFFHYIPRHFTVNSLNILTGYYEGDSTLYRTDHLREWLLPAVTWIGFMSIC